MSPDVQNGACDILYIAKAARRLQENQFISLSPESN
jgi:hypothetical protein